MARQTRHKTKGRLFTQQKSTTALDAVKQDAAKRYAGRDSRVVERDRTVLLFELSATEDHLRGLAESTAKVKAQKASLEAQIEGLASVLARR